jgi:2-dehydropantoate 2-reductase
MEDLFCFAFKNAILRRGNRQGDLMKIRLIGSGSLGMLFAGRLGSLGTAVIELITRSKEQAQEIAARGVRVTSPEHELVVWPEAAWEEGSLNGQAPDWIFLMVKQQQITDKLIRGLADQLADAPHAKLVCFQNGIGHTDWIKRYIPEERIYIAITTEGAKRLELCTVEHTGTGTTWIGPAFETKQGSLEGTLSEEKEMIPLIDLMNQAGFQTYASKSMGRIQWNKLLINAVINPLTAILRIPNGELLHNSHALGLMEVLYTEGCQIAAAKGVTVADDIWLQILTVCRKTARNHSSMLQDILAGRKTEIDRINGSLVAYADELGIDVPVQRSIYALIKATEG